MHCTSSDVIMVVVGDLSSISALDKTFRFRPTCLVSSAALLLLRSFCRTAGDALKRLNGFFNGLSLLSNTSSSETLSATCFFTFFRRFGGIFPLQKSTSTDVKNAHAHSHTHMHFGYNKQIVK